MNDKRRLRILHTESSCGWGGQEIRILTETQGMLARGHEVELVCPPQSNIYRVAGEMGLKVTALPIAKKKLAGLKALRRFLRANRFDVINTHSSTDSWLTALAVRLNWGKRPAVVRSRHLSTPVSNNRATRWLYTRGNDFLVTTGEILRQTLHSDNGVPLEQMRSVPTGIDTGRFLPAADVAAVRRQLGLPQDKQLIGIVATIRSWKGHRYLVEALAKLQRPDVQLVIVGDGPSRHIVEETVDQLNLREQVTFVGNQRDVVPYLQALDLFALPSTGNEGVPQGIMQAMLCHNPVIATPVGSVEEVVKHERTGLIVPVKDSEALAGALRRLLDDPALRGRYADEGLAYARAHCTLETMVEAMETIFRQVSRPV